MKTISKCENVKIATKKNKWFIVDKDEKYEMNQNEAYLIYKDYLSQVIYLGADKARLNLNLKGK